MTKALTDEELATFGGTIAEEDLKKIRAVVCHFGNYFDGNDAIPTDPAGCGEMLHAFIVLRAELNRKAAACRHEARRLQAQAEEHKEWADRYQSRINFLLGVNVKVNQ